MYCMKCGAKIEEGTAFCSRCGNTVGGEQKSAVHQSRPMPNSGMFPEADGMKPKMSKKRLGIIVGAAAGAVVLIAAIIIAVVALSGSRGRSYEATVDQYMNGVFNADIEAYVDAFPKAIVDEEMDYYGYDSDEKKEFLEDGQKTLDNAVEDMDEEAKDGWHMEYTIEDIQKASRDVLKETRLAYEDLDMEVSEAIEVDVHMYTKVGDDGMDSLLTLPLIKVGKAWYIDGYKVPMGILWE